MSNPKWTTDDIADLTGRVAVVTGANTGLGLETARELAAKNATVVLAVRDLGKGEKARADITAGVPDADVSVQALDLASLDSIRTASADLHERFDAIDLLVNNAGVMFTPKSTTADGFELQLGVNHLGHFALTGLLLDLMLAVDGSRIVTVSSGAHKFKSTFDLADLAGTDGYNRTAAYGRSKVANLLFTYELQRRLTAGGAPTMALAAHPGGSNTELGRNAPAAMRAARCGVPAVHAERGDGCAADPAGSDRSRSGRRPVLRTRRLRRVPRTPRARRVQRALTRPRTPARTLECVRGPHRCDVPGLTFPVRPAVALVVGPVPGNSVTPPLYGCRYGDRRGDRAGGAHRRGALRSDCGRRVDLVGSRRHS